LASHLEGLLKIPGSRLYRQFKKAAQNVRGTQAAVLGEILSYLGDTAVGHSLGLKAATSYDAFAARVPIHDYEMVRPHIDRHARGERNVLLPEQPIMYNRSSGTTAKPKLLPVTPYSFDRTVKSRGKLWLYGLMKQFPGIYSGKDFTVVSPAVEGHTEDGTPFGSMSGLVYQNIPGFMKLVHAVPAKAFSIHHYASKAYALLRCALPEDVTVILTGNPSTLLNFAQRADTWKERLIRDIRDGTLDPTLEIEGDIRAHLEAGLAPNPTAAARLELLARQSEVLRPRDYWPNLRLVHTWKNGNCRLIIPRLAEWFNQETPMLDFGYLASEIAATDLILKENDGSILQVRSAFYEFTRLDEGDAPDRRFYLAHELVPGERYFIYVTTFGGLLRYDMNDVIEVLGFFHDAPVLRFLFKGKGITNIVGEKLSEQQLIEAVRLAAARTGTAHEFFVGYADLCGRSYELFIELLPAESPEGAQRFAIAVDEALREVNVEYDAKRDSDRLDPIRIVPMGPGFFERYVRLRLEQGTHEGQLKWLQLSSTEATRERMRHLSEPPQPYAPE
jgi:hypothetical protein